MKTLPIALFGTALIVVVMLNIHSCRFFDIDTCLDHGGRWNDETKSCETVTHQAHVTG